MIYLTGDLHGDPSRLLSENLTAKGLSIGRGDTVIICGDFGLLWQAPSSAQELQWLQWLDEQSFTTLFIDGNHENFELLQRFPVTVYAGGQAQQIRQHVYHLMRGEIFTLEGKTFFCFGGAHSVDQNQREEHVSWWPAEVLSSVERNRAIRNLKEHKYVVDYVITHTAPLSFISEKCHFQLTIPCSVRTFLTELEPCIQYKHWYFGHFHEDYESSQYACTWLYKEIRKIDASVSEKI